jgi:Protein of unknown function (DUF3105)
MAKGERRAQAPRKATKQRRTVIAVAVAVLAAAVVGYFAYRAQANLPGVQFADQGNLHVPSPDTPHEKYNSDPPTSGPHLPYIAPWGVHTRPIVRELQVHNLEDGGVVVQYNCECPDLVAKLKAIVDGYDRQVILAPYPGMPHKIALTAWTRLDTLDELDEGRVKRFIEAYRGIDHHK